MQKSFILGVFMVGMFLSCSPKQDKPESQPLPEVVDTLKNLTVYSFSSQADTVILTKDQTFGDTDEVFFSAMGEFTVDDSGRIYIEDGGWGSRSLHVYNPDGSYHSKIAGEGKGPAEFLNLRNLVYRDNKLLFYDSELSRMTIYSVDSIRISKMTNIDRRAYQSIHKWGTYPKHFFLIDNNQLLIGFAAQSFPENADSTTVKYYKVNEDFELISDKIYEHKGLKVVWADDFNTNGNTRFKASKVYPFFERSLFVISNDNYIYTARTGEFLIKKYNLEGEFQSAFYYPSQKFPITRSHAIDTTSSLTDELDDNVKLPKYWPVLDRMYIDDKDRIWVSTFTESNNYFQWYVLNNAGELLAEFKWPGEKTRHPGSIDALKVIKNGYFYAREENPDTGQREVVRYKIEFTKR